MVSWQRIPLLFESVKNDKTNVTCEQIIHENLLFIGSANTSSGGILRDNNVNRRVAWSQCAQSHVVCPECREKLFWLLELWCCQPMSCKCIPFPFIMAFVIVRCSFSRSRKHNFHSFVVLLRPAFAFFIYIFTVPTPDSHSTRAKHVSLLIQHFRCFCLRRAPLKIAKISINE